MIADFDCGRCRSCGGPLQILDTNRSRTVTCVDCADTYDLEPTALDDSYAADPFVKTVPRRKGSDA